MTLMQALTLAAKLHKEGKVKVWDVTWYGMPPDNVKWQVWVSNGAGEVAIRAAEDAKLVLNPAKGFREE